MIKNTLAGAAVRCSPTRPAEPTMDPITINHNWTISALDPDPRNNDRVLVSLTPDTPLAEARTLTIHIGVVAQAGLRVGLVLDAARLAELQAANTFQASYNRALDFLAVRPRSAWEVRDRLRRKAVPEDDIPRVIERLERAGYLDDAAFARFWIEERARSSPRGPRLLQQELRRKGVSGPVIAQELAAFEARRAEESQAQQAALNEENLPMIDEEESADPQYVEALGVARRKHRTYAKLDESTYRRRMTAFLQRRGYNYSLISRVLKALRAGEDTEDGE
jgi:regulatory protein